MYSILYTAEVGRSVLKSPENADHGNFSSLGRAHILLPQRLCDELGRIFAEYHDRHSVKAGLCM